MFPNDCVRGGNNGGTRERTFPESLSSSQFPESFTEKSTLSNFLNVAVMVRNGRVRGGNNGRKRERTFPESVIVSANSQKVLPKNRPCLTS